MSVTIIGLDIGSSGLRAVEVNVSKKKRIAVINFHEISIPTGAVIHGKIVDRVIVVKAIKKLWLEGGFKSKKVIIGIGNEKVIVRDLTLPKSPIASIRESLPFHVQEMLQFPVSESLLDFYPISQSEGEHPEIVNGLLVAVEKDDVIKNIEIIEGAGLLPMQVDLTAFALSRAFIRGGIGEGVGEENKEGHLGGSVAVIDVGGNSTSIVIAKDGVPLFVRIIPVGGNNLTQALVEGLDITEIVAESLKRTLQVGPDLASREEFDEVLIDCTCVKCQADIATADDSRTTEILQRITGDLLLSLRSTINYFNNTRSSEPVREIILTGGGAQLAGLDAALFAMTKIPISQKSPFALLALSEELEMKRAQFSPSAFAVAYGLALQGPL